MIKRLNIVIAETVEGELKVVHLGRSRQTAAMALQEVVGDEAIKEVIHIRHPKAIKRRRPAAMVARAKEEAAAAAEAAAAEATPAAKAAAETIAAGVAAGVAAERAAHEAAMKLEKERPRKPGRGKK